MKNNLNQSYDFAVCHNPAITNVQIKPHSNICTSIAMGVFKGFLSRALHICSENHLPQEIDFLINVFVENGHSITVLEKVSEKYMKNIIFKKEEVNIEIIKNDKIVKLPWVRKLGPRLSWEFKKFGIKTTFTSGSNLKNLICRNKSKLLPNSFPGVYQLDCTCNVLYIGETRKKFITRTIEHQQYSFSRRCVSSGATEHCLECHGQFNWINLKTLSTEQQYHRRKIRESLEIKKAKTNKRRKDFNRYEGNLVKTNTWTQLFAKLTKKETNTKA